MKKIATALLLAAACFSPALHALEGPYVKASVTAEGMNIWEFPYMSHTYYGAFGIPHTTEFMVSSGEGVPQDVAAQGIGWKIRVYSNHPLYNGNKFRKPIIITQGFEPDFGYENDTFDDFGRDLSLLFDEANSAPVTSEANLLRQFYDMGHEIVLVKYLNPNQALNLNAWALQGAIWHVHNNSQSPSTPIRVIGPSMGGLIARYAIQTMRQRYTGNLPSISHLVAFDCPNRGAVIPISVQAFLYYVGYNSEAPASLKKNRENLLSPGAKQMLLYHINPPGGYGDQTDNSEQTVADYEDANSEHGQFMADINSPASLQALADYYRHSAGHYRIQTSAITNGSGRSPGLGLPQQVRITHLTGEFEASECPWWSAWCGGVSPDFADLKLSTGSGGNVQNLVFDGDLDGWMVEDGQDAWTFRFKEPVFVESAPGGIRRTYSQIKNEWDGTSEDRYNMTVEYYNSTFNAGHAFIPTFSALGLRKEHGYDVNTSSNWYHDYLADGNALKGKSIFTNLYMPERSLDHMMVTLQSKQWFLNELKKEIRPIPTSVLSLLLD